MPTIHAESEVRNESTKARTFHMEMLVRDPEGKMKIFTMSAPVTLQPGETRILWTANTAHDLHFWSWGYGYLYNVETSLVENDVEIILDKCICHYLLFFCRP